MEQSRKIPTVPFSAFVKRAFEILKNPLPFHHDNFEKHGDIFQLRIGFNTRIIFCRDAGLARYVLQKNQRNYTKSPIQTMDLAKYVGKGLLTAEGSHWRTQRKLIQPAFHKKQLALLIEVMDKAIAQALQTITPFQPTDIFPVFNDLAFQTVVKALFSNAATQEEINRLQYITEAAQKMLVKELRQPYLSLWFRYGGPIKKHLALTQEARDMLQRMVEARQASGERKDDLLDMLLEARYEDGSEMPMEQLLDEILILFTAGHETTSNALTFAAELLARHPECQEKVYKEVKEARASSADLMSFLRQCTYTQQVIEETMRLYPPAYFIDRVNLEDDAYEGYHLPKGSNLLLSMIEVHRSETYWKDPLRFDPDRFDSAFAKAHSDHYFPFGAGPRMCIGNNFAMYEMILAVAQLIEHYQIAPETKEIEILPMITLKPKNAILTLTPRE